MRKIMGGSIQLDGCPSTLLFGIAVLDEPDVFFHFVKC
jgi:hypothetical protein